MPRHHGIFSERLVPWPKRQNTRRLRSIPTFLLHISLSQSLWRRWARRTQLLPRARPTHKERNRRRHDPPIPCTTCLGYHPARECRSCSWVHWGGECGVIIKFSLFIYISLNFIQVYCIVFISFFPIIIISSSSSIINIIIFIIIVIIIIITGNYVAFPGIILGHYGFV